jgi:hypothetical protein
MKPFFAGKQAEFYLHLMRWSVGSLTSARGVFVGKQRNSETSGTNEKMLHLPRDN